MKPKLVKVGEVEYVEARNGKPLYVEDDGAVVEGDLPYAVGKVKELSQERETLKGQLATATAALEPWKGQDPSKVKAALELAANIDAKKLIDAGEVEKVKEQVAAGYKTQIETLTTEQKTALDAANARLAKHMRLSALGAAEYRKQLQEGLRPVDIMDRVFGDYFVPEGDRLVAVVNGQRLMSRKRPGDPADVEEALEMIVSNRADKESLLAPVGADGGGSRRTEPASSTNGSKTMTRAQFGALSSEKKAEFGHTGGQIVG